MNLFCCGIVSIFMDLSVVTAGPSSMSTRDFGGSICEWNSLTSFQVFVWLLCIYPWQKFRQYLPRALVTSYGIASRLVIYLISISLLACHTFAASLGGNGCNENCNLSVDHFCQLLYNTKFHCMECKMVCANEDSESDRNVCNENCQASQYYRNLPAASTRPSAIAPTTNTSTLKPSTPSSWKDTFDELTPSTVGPTFQDSVVSFTSQAELVADFPYSCFFTIALIVALLLIFFAWLCCHCASSRKRCKISSSDSKGRPIPMEEIKVPDEGSTPYQTGRPATENVAVPPSDEKQQEEVPDFLRTNKAIKKGTATLVMTPNPSFSPEDIDQSKSEMALSDDSSKILPAKFCEER